LLLSGPKFNRLPFSAEIGDFTGSDNSFQKVLLCKVGKIPIAVELQHSFGIENEFVLFLRNFRLDFGPALNVILLLRDEALGLQVGKP
jgi:hypothetical protein